MSGPVEIFKASKGPAVTAHNAITDSAVSAAIDMNGYNAALVEVVIAGAGMWKVDMQGKLVAADAACDLYDNYDNQLTTGNLSASRTRLFVGLPDLLYVKATETSGTAACTVRVVPMNV